MDNEAKRRLDALEKRVKDLEDFTKIRTANAKKPKAKKSDGK